MTAPALFQALAQLNQTATLLAGLLQFLLHGFAFPGQGRAHFLILPPGGLGLGLEGGAILPDLFAQLQKLLATLFEMGGQLFFLTFEGFATLLELNLLLGKVGLLRRHRRGLDAQGVALGLEGRRLRRQCIIRGFGRGDGNGFHAGDP